MVDGHISQITLERANFDGAVVWNHFVMLSSGLGGHPNV
jgi:hypothetical protein